ncbi:MAG: ABC transporter permease [Chloroflexota bacterium]|nr:ABC transporter permease [Chloroflexota bacterium]
MTVARAAFPAGNALRVAHRNLLVYRRTWRGSLFFSFLQPFLYLTAMGLGLGQLMHAGTSSALGGVSYPSFLAPGLLAAACMQTAVFECSWPILAKIRWRRNYEAMLATPLAVDDLLVGELAWIGVRVATVSGAFLAIIVAFRIATSPLAVLALPAAMLTGLGFAAAMIAFTATQHNDAGFSWVFRFVMNPLFLFSGVFFPVERLPDAIEWVARLTPLYHGAALVRGLVLGSVDPFGAVVHLGYLVAFLAVGVMLARRTLTRRLVK